MLEHLLGRLLRPLVRGVAIGIFEKFPNQRRNICKGMLMIGFLMPMPLMGFIWTGHTEDVPSGWGIPLLCAAALGIVLLAFALFLLREINSLGEIDERI
jgi:hypothetical protein